MYYEIKIFDSIIFADTEEEAKAKLNSKIIMIMYEDINEDEKIEIVKRGV